jgi:HPr kinase/phosphorylase
MAEANGVPVAELVKLEQLRIEAQYNPAHLGNRISHPRPQRPGLGMSGYLEHLNPSRVQVLGKTEIGYMRHLSVADRRQRFAEYVALGFPVIIQSESKPVDPQLVELADARRTPVLVSALKTSLLVSRLTSFLYQFFSRKIKLNGVLMDVMGQGLMITGASGVGKSETALELINKGYHLISDDVIEFYLDSNEDPVGRAHPEIRNLLEVRGLGIINISDVFGASAVLEEKKLDLAIKLERWDPKKKYDRLGEDSQTLTVLGKEVPLFTLPVAPGRNVSTIIEVAVRHFLARKMGRKTYLELKAAQRAAAGGEPAKEPQP